MSAAALSSLRHTFSQAGASPSGSSPSGPPPSGRQAPGGIRAGFAAVALIVAVALIACRPLLLHGATFGHSIEYNLVWLEHFSAQLAAGDWYPRWLMGMNRGAGSPVFFYYAPLPFYLASLGVGLFPHLNLNLQLAVGETLLIALSGLSFLYFARRRVALTAAVPAACLYMLLPYHFEIDLWLRQDIGELAMYICMPLVLHFALQILHAEAGSLRRAQAGLAVAYAGVMFSHLPSGLLFSICLGACVVVCAAHQGRWRRLPAFAAGIALGVALAAVYWLPALFTQQYIHADRLWTAFFDFHHWLYPVAPAVDSAFVRRLVQMQQVGGVLFALFCIAAWRRSRHLLPALVLMGVAWLLDSQASAWLWEHAPALHKVQFPWRVTVVMDLALALAAMEALAAWRERPAWRAGTAIAGAGALLAYCLVSANVGAVLKADACGCKATAGTYAVRDGLDAPEYTTPWSQWSADDIVHTPALDAPVDYDPRAGRVHVVAWSPEGIALSVHLQRPTDLEVRQFYFPSWRSFVPRWHLALKMWPAAHSGLLRVHAPAGVYRLDLQMTPLLQQWLGSAISALALLATMALLVLPGWRRPPSIASRIRAQSVPPKAAISSLTKRPSSKVIRPNS